MIGSRAVGPIDPFFTGPLQRAPGAAQSSHPSHPAESILGFRPKVRARGLGGRRREAGRGPRSRLDAATERRPFGGQRDRSGRRAPRPEMFKPT